VKGRKSLEEKDIKIRASTEYFGKIEINYG